MSDQAIGKLVRERWPEFLVLVVVVGLAKVVYDFNREVGQLATGQTALDGRMGRIETGIDKIDGRLERLGELPTAVAVLSEKVNSLAREVSQDDNRRQVAYTTSMATPPQGIARTINQSGTLSPATKTTAVGFNYRWPIAIRFDESSIRNIYAGFEDTIVGAAISAKISPDGKYFEIEVSGTGDTELPGKLQAGITAWVSVTVIDWPSPVPKQMMVDPAPSP